MSHESLNYFLESLPHPRLPPPLPKPELSLDEVVEETWLSLDKDDARCVLEAYGNNLTEYQWKLLDHVLFGCENSFQYAEEKTGFAIKLHQLLDRILFL